MRSGNSNATVAAVFGLQRPQQVSEISDSVISSFERDVLPFRFGISTRSRDDLIQTETSRFARNLFGCKDRLALIYDGTYIRHGKSANSSYQRKSYSGQKKTHLCKPFTICTTTGFVVDMLGPFTANLNDARIMEIALQDPSGLGGLLKAGDICFVDRGFRDVVGKLRQKGLTVLMPALKGGRKQLTTEEANHSRFVTKIRWAVEAVHGMIKQKCRILDQRVDNDLLPKIGVLTKIACYLNNTFGQRLESDRTMLDEVVGRMQSMRSVANSLAQEVEEKGWNRAMTCWCAVDSNSVPHFPELSERELVILFTGTYQLSQAVSYLAEMMNEDGTFSMKYHRDLDSILKVEVRSRHVNRKVYKCYVDYTRDATTHKGIRRPAEILSGLFHDGAAVPVIEEDSDED